MYQPYFYPNVSAATQFQVKKAHPRSKFTKEEDELLKDLVANLGDNNWQVISSRMPGRNSRQCRERWQNYLCPEIINGPWTQEEDDLLVLKYNELGPSWKQISTFFPTRTDINIKSRWNLRERHIKKEELKRKKMFFQKKIGLKTSNNFDVLQNQQLIQMFPTLQKVQPTCEVKKEIIDDEKKNEISEQPLPFFYEKVQDVCENEQEIGLVMDDGFEAASNECFNFLLMNEENAFDQWF